MSTTTTESRSIADLLYERKRQDEKWGEQNHAALGWLPILAEEFGEVAKEVCQFVPPNTAKPSTEWRLYDELIQTAAVCIAWAECLQRKYAEQEEA